MESSCALRGTNGFRLLAGLLCVLLVFAALPPALSSASSLPVAVVNNPNPADRLNLRTRPSASAPSLGKYYTGVRVEIVDDTLGDWCEVKVSGIEGYMQKKYLYFGPEIWDIPILMPTATVCNPKATDRLNLRELPSFAARSLDKYYNGTSVTVLGVAGSWYHVSVQGKTGYMLGAYLSVDGQQAPSPGPTATPPGTFPDQVGVVKNPGVTDRLNLRKSPSASSASLGRYYTGTLVRITGESSGGWYKVQVGNQTGYMQKQYIALQGDIRYNGKFAAVNLSATSGMLKLFQSASNRSAVLGQYKNGAVVEVLGSTGSFCRVRIYDKEGYMEKSGLQVDGEPGKRELIPLQWGVADDDADGGFLMVYSYPSTAVPTLGRFPNGTRMDILGSAGTWYYVAVRIGENESIPALRGQTVRGFVQGQYLNLGGGDTGGKLYGVIANPVSSDRLNLRSKPSESAAPLGKYLNTTQVEVLETLDGGWYHVSVDGKEGYMRAQYIRILSQGDPSTW